MDGYVERLPVEAFCKFAGWKGGVRAAAMRLLESKHPGLKGRRFCGTFRPLPKGEQYYACVERIETDDPEGRNLVVGTIPGGLFLRRRIYYWGRVIAAGELSTIF